jgi:ClpP class serine protease
MSDFRLISAILRRAWLLDPTWAAENQYAVARFLKGKESNFKPAASRGQEQRVATLNRPEGSILFTPGYYSGFQNAPEGSIAYIEITGPIMKYGFCGYGSYELNQIVREAYATPNIKGLFYEYDTPGGQVDGIATFGDTIAASPKPDVGFVNDGMCCSGGMWTGTAHRELYASQDLDYIGSIGVYQSWYDQTEYLKKLGIKRVERYAPQSTEKNKVSKDAAAGNFTLLDEELFAVAQKFIDTIARNRGERLKGSNDEWNKGKASTATWALETGLIDGIITREAALARLEALCDGAADLRTSTTPTNTAQTQSTDMKFPKVFSLAGKAEPTETELTEANAELAEAGITGVALMPESVVTEAAAVTTQLNETTANVNKLTGELNTANAAKTKVEGDLATANATIKTLNEKVEAFGKNAGGKHTQETGDDTPPSTSADDDFETILANMPHNKKADSL